MIEEEVENLLEIGSTIDKEWERYASEHATRSQSAFQEQMSILDEIHTDVEPSTRMLLKSIIHGLEHLQMEQRREVSSAINTAIQVTRSVILNIFNTTREYVQRFERIMTTESHAAIHKISHIGQTTMTESPDVNPMMHYPEHDLRMRFQEQNEYSAMHWDLRIRNFVAMIDLGVSGMSSIHARALKEMESVHACCTEQESQIKRLKDSVRTKKEYIQNLIEKIRQTELEMDRLRQDQQHCRRETKMAREEVIAQQNAQKRQFEDISYETTVAIKELERIVIHFERMAGIQD